MEEVWHDAPYTVPFLRLGTRRHIMFPETGRNVPFKVENYAYLDELGRETVTWIRTFQTKPPRRFDAYMIYSEERGRIVDYMGTHQHLAVDIELGVASNGGLQVCSNAQRFYEGLIGFKFPMFLSGVADACEWYDDVAQCFRIEVAVRNSTWGRIFGYKGRFQAAWQAVGAADIPATILPCRTERRE